MKVNQPLQSQPLAHPQPQPTPQAFSNQQFQGFEQQNHAPQVHPEPQLDNNNEIVSGHQHKAEYVTELEGMGFEKALVEQALVAAFYNKERAIDYLLNV